MVPMRTHCTVLWAISLAFLMLGTGRVEGETILIDDFSDGNDDGWSHFGLDLTGGEAWGSGTFDATSLNYRLEGSGAVPKREQGTLFSLWDGSAHTSFTDGFMRATVRADSDALVYLLMRANTETVSAYIFGADPSTEEFFFHKVVRLF